MDNICALDCREFLKRQDISLNEDSNKCVIKYFFFPFTCTHSLAFKQLLMKHLR